MAQQGGAAASPELVVCAERGAAFQGGAALALSRLVQQLEPTWQAVWGHRAEERHIRQAQLSSRDADDAELGRHLRPRGIALVLLWCAPDFPARPLLSGRAAGRAPHARCEAAPAAPAVPHALTTGPVPAAQVGRPARSCLPGRPRCAPAQRGAAHGHAAARGDCRTHGEQGLHRALLPGDPQRRSQHFGGRLGPRQPGECVWPEAEVLPVAGAGGSRG
jgi:hypothetical protein